jgi:holo-[acyl-carrier protein] synthase
VRIVTGCDIVDVARIAAVVARRPGFVARVFTAAEVDDCTRGGVQLSSPVGSARLAARFAAKEAARKALGDLRLPFHAVEVRRDRSGAPVLHLHGRPTSWSCSLSHDAGVALAVVVGATDDPTPAPDPTTAPDPAQDPGPTPA